MDKQERRMQFPQALSDALGLPSDTTMAILEFFKNGWEKLSEEEKRSLFEDLRSESDFGNRILIALSRLLPVLYP